MRPIRKPIYETHPETHYESPYESHTNHPMIPITNYYESPYEGCPEPSPYPSRRSDLTGMLDVRSRRSIGEG